MKTDWELFKYRLIEGVKDVFVLLAAVVLTALLIATLSGCAFSLPIGQRHRMDVQIHAQLTGTEPLPDIWLGDK
jgi:hypothetical protein